MTQHPDPQQRCQLYVDVGVRAEVILRDPKHPQKKLGTLWGYIGDQLALYLYTSTGKKVGQRPAIGPLRRTIGLRSRMRQARRMNPEAPR